MTVCDASIIFLLCFLGTGGTRPHALKNIPWKKMKLCVCVSCVVFDKNSQFPWRNISGLGLHPWLCCVLPCWPWQVDSHRSRPRELTGLTLPTAVMWKPRARRLTGGRSSTEATAG